MTYLCDICGSSNANYNLWKDSMWIRMCFMCYNKDGMKRLEELHK